MSPKTILRSLALILTAFSFLAGCLAAQDQPSVAEAARRAREQKQAAPKPARVIDNDSLPPSHSAPANPAADSAATEANPATPASPSDSNAATPENASAPQAEKSADSAEDAAEKKAKIDALKQQIADKKGKVDLQQREIALAQDSFYSNPDHEHDRAGKGKLDSMQADLEQQKTELAELQAQLAELGDSGDTKPAPAPPQP